MIYLFGELAHGYTQNLDDYTSAIFKEIEKAATERSQIAVHRNGNLMYYCYFRRLSNKKRYFGFCVVVNGMMVARPLNLFPIFEQVYDQVYLSGEILCLNENGDVDAVASSLMDVQKEVSNISDILQSKFDHVEGGFKKLPPVNYSVSDEDWGRFSYEDDESKIIKASYTYDYTLIYKKKGYASHTERSYRGIIRKMKKEKDERDKTISELEEKNKKLQREKTRSDIITWLVLIIAGGLAVGFIWIKTLNQDLDDSKSEVGALSHDLALIKDSLSNSQLECMGMGERIRRYKVTVDSFDYALDQEKNEKNSLEFQLEQEKQVHSETKNQYEALKRSNSGTATTMVNQVPFVVRNTSINWESKTLTVSYYATSSRNITLDVKAINEKSGVIYKKTKTLYISVGANSFNVTFDSNLNKNDWHSFIVLYDKKILGGGRH